MADALDETGARGGFDPAVAVVGAGPIGLTTFLALRRAGVDAVLIEKHATTAQIPKALVLNQRTMEILRQLGLEGDVRRASLSREDVGFIFHGQSLTSSVYERVPLLSDSDKSAVGACLCSQDALEPVLRAHAERLAPGKVWFGIRAEGLSQDHDGVDLRLVDANSGAKRSLRTRYAVAADGARSALREMLGVKMDGAGSLGHAVHVVFKAPLGRWVADRASAMYYVKGDLLFVIVDGEQRWRLMVNDYDPRRDGELSEARVTELIREGAGVPDLEVEIQGIFPWEPSALLADQFRSGRVFLAGDAAHVRPPWGGLGMNAGVGDAQNIAWKLAEVLAGRAGEDLLDTYEQERRPVAQRTIQAAIRNRGQGAKVSSPDLGVREAAARHRRAEGLVLGYTYSSSAIVEDDSSPPAVEDQHAEYVPAARPGHRAPHFWIKDGRSVTDLFGGGYVLLAGRAGSAWTAAAAELASRWHISLRTYIVGGDADGDLPDPLDWWTRLYCQSPEGAVLVRPDGHVAWRCDGLPADPDRELQGALRCVLSRSGRTWRQLV